MTPKQRKAMTSSKKMDWGTPDEVFGPLNDEFYFNIDLAASHENTKCESFFTPASDSLSQNWAETLEMLGGWAWLNCPYGRELKKWVAKAALERKRGANVVMLIPARTETRYFHEHIWDAEKRCPREGIEVRFLKGRISFIDPDTGEAGDPALFPSMVVVFRGADQKPEGVPNPWGQSNWNGVDLP